MDEEIQLAPLRLDLAEGGVHRVHIGNVALDQEIAAHLLRQRADTLLQRLSLVGKGHVCALLVQLFRDTPSQRLVVGEAHDQALLAGHQSTHAAVSSVLCAAPLFSGVFSLRPASSSGVSAIAAFSSPPATIPKPTSQKKKSAIITPASDP